MEKIPTAEEFLLKDKNYEELHLDYPKLSKAIQESMIEFAKLHVEAAMYAKGKSMKEKSYEDSSYSIGELDAFTRHCYPLENIK